MIRLVSLFFFVLLPALYGTPAPAAEEPAGKTPVTVKADKLDYDRTNDIYVAEGHVKVEQNDTRIEADRLTLNNRTGEATAEGNVYLHEKGDTVRAQKLQVNINTKSGFIYKGDLFMSKENLHFTGEKIERLSETEYRIEKGTFTTCDEGEWYLKADEISLDLDRYATGRGVSFNMVGLPVFYTPYLLFPVRRQTGLLIPEVGFSSSEGFLMKNFFFWAISDFQDMTFYSDYRARHGHGSAVEYRYVNSRDSSGIFFYNYFNTFDRYYGDRYGERALTDSLPPDARWLLSYQHHEEIAEDLSVRADINLVSDDAYFRDLEKSLELRSRPYLDSNLFYVERWNTASLYLLGQYAIDLTKRGNETTIQKMPELRYTIFEEKIAGPLHVNLEGSATNFTRQSGNNVMRADFNPRLSAVFGNAGVTFTPRLGARATYYDRSTSSSEPVERKYYYAGADLNARLSRIYGRDGEAGFGRIRHSIEPGISYSYLPRFEQTNIPQLDAIDTILSQNIVAVSIINRLTAHYKDQSGFKTFDMVVFRLSEFYDLNKARSDDPAVSARASSEIRSELFIKTPKLLTLSATENYDTHEDRFSSSSESISVNADRVRFNISRQYLRVPETKYIIGGAGTKVGLWDVDFQFWRDIVLRTTTQQEYKAHYASQCWGLGLMYVKKPGETQYLLTLELKGLGALKF
jgi:LPS-assembly protein